MFDEVVFGVVSEVCLKFVFCSDLVSQWIVVMNVFVIFVYFINYLIDIDNVVIVDVEVS